MVLLKIVKFEVYKNNSTDELVAAEFGFAFEPVTEANGPTSLSRLIWAQERAMRTRVRATSLSIGSLLQK